MAPQETVNFVSASVFPEAKLMGKFPLGPVIKYFVIPPNSKSEQYVEKLFANCCWLVHKFARVSRSMTW